MKRLVWLLLAVLSTAFAQVQPVVSPLTNNESCCCGDGSAGACGMPDCAPAPAACQSGLTLQTPAAQRTEARKLSPAARVKPGCYFAKFGSRPALTPAWRASLAGAPAAHVPLFKAHCSLLI
jgi:hypothetical protein